MAYVLGFFAADGYITVNKRGGQFWCIQITDKLLLQDIKKVVGAEHVISKRKRVGNEKASYRIQIGSIEMCNDLRYLGFGERKAKRLVLPNVPRKYFCDFVRGYFDGDGNVWMGKIHKDRRVPMMALRVVFTSCSQDFLSRLKDTLNEAIKTNGSVIIQDSYARLQYSIKDSLQLYNFMYNTLGSSRLFLTRKRPFLRLISRLVYCGRSSIG